MLHDDCTERSITTDMGGMEKTTSELNLWRDQDLQLKDIGRTKISTSVLTNKHRERTMY